jgi:hypothetical protein
MTKQHGLSTRGAHALRTVFERGTKGCRKRWNALSAASAADVAPPLDASARAAKPKSQKAEESGERS